MLLQVRHGAGSRLKALKKEAEAFFERKASEFDADPFCINVHNGTLFIRKPGDVRTNLPLPKRARSVDPDKYVYFLPHDPADLCTKITPVDYVPGATYERFDAFLRRVQPDDKMRRQLAAWKGYGLTGDISEQKLSVYHGTGSNGKSVWEEVTSYIAGDYAATVPIETFLDEGYARRAGQATPDLARLPGVRMLRTSEPRRGAALNEALIKLATGGELMTARHLNHPFFDFYPEFKLTVSSNYRPRIRGTDEGIWRRVDLVPWAVKITEEEKNRHLAIELRVEACPSPTGAANAVTSRRSITCSSSTPSTPWRTATSSGWHSSCPRARRNRPTPRSCLCLGSWLGRLAPT